VAAWEHALGLVISEGVAVAGGGVTLHRHLWYSLTCGAAVPNGFIGLNLDRPTHFARGPVGATRHLRQVLPLYVRLLSVTGAFLREVVVKTRELLECGCDLWGYTPAANAPRVTINHAAREETGGPGLVGAREGSASEEDSEETDPDMEEDEEVGWDGAAKRVAAALRRGDAEGAAAVLRNVLRPLLEVAEGGTDLDQDQLAELAGLEEAEDQDQDV